MKNKEGIEINTGDQYYQDVKINCIARTYGDRKAMRFILNGSNQNLWIPKKYLKADGTLKDGVNLDWLFYSKNNYRKIEISHLKK